MRHWFSIVNAYRGMVLRACPAVRAHNDMLFPTLDALARSTSGRSVMHPPSYSRVANLGEGRVRNADGRICCSSGHNQRAELPHRRQTNQRCCECCRLPWLSRTRGATSPSYPKCSSPATTRQYTTFPALTIPGLRQHQSPQAKIPMHLGHSHDVQRYSPELMATANHNITTLPESFLSSKI